MSQLASTVLSVLDLAPIRQGGSAAETFRDSVSLAQHTESLGYQRYWLAEHHNIAGIVSAATAVLIGHVSSLQLAQQLCYFGQSLRGAGMN